MYHYAGGSGGAVVNVPAGKYVSKVRATATAAGASVQVGAAGDVVPVDNPGSLEFDMQRGLVGPVAITFVGVGSFVVEWFDTNLSGAMGGP